MSFDNKRPGSIATDKVDDDVNDLTSPSDSAIDMMKKKKRMN